jgi:hypothetical protein
MTNPFSLKLGTVASHTIDYLAAALPRTRLRHGLSIDVPLAAYGQVIRINDTPSTIQTARETLPDLHLQILTDDSATGPVDVL